MFFFAVWCLFRFSSSFLFCLCLFLTENEPVAQNAAISMQAIATNAHLKNIRGSKLNTEQAETILTNNGTKMIDVGTLIGQKKFGIIIVYDPTDLSKTRTHIRAPAAQLQRVGSHSFYDTRYKPYKQVVLSKPGINKSDEEETKLTNPNAILQASTAKHDFWILVAPTFYGFDDELTSVIKGDASTKFWWPQQKEQWKQCWMHNVAAFYSQATYEELASFCYELFNQDLALFQMYNQHFIQANTRYARGIVKFHNTWGVKSEWVVKYGGYGPIAGESTREELTFLGPKFSFVWFFFVFSQSVV